MNLKKKRALALVIALILAFADITVCAYAVEEEEVFSEAEFIKNAVRVEEIEEKRTANSDTYLMSDGQYQCVVYAEDKYYTNEENKYVEIDNSIVKIPDSKTEYKYVNKESSTKTYFTNGTVPKVKIEHGGRSISFEALAADRVKDGENQDITESAAAETARKSILVVGAKSSAEALKDIAPVHRNSATYHSVYASTDITYIVQNKAVKEFIILNEANAQNSFAFKFELNGMTAEQTEKGEILFKDGKETVFELGRLFAKDAAGAYTTDLTYSLRQMREYAVITVTLSEEYASSADRVYPIVIDPTVMVSGSDSTYDTYISSSYPDSNYYLSTTLRTGRDSTYGICRTYIKFDLPNISSSSVTNANIALEKESGATPSLVANKVISSWGSSWLTWTDMASFTSEVSSGNSYQYSGNWYRMDVTDMVKAWLAGSYPNYGVVVRSNSETTNGTGTLFYSSDSVSPHRPELNITYGSESSGGGITVNRVSSSYADTAPYREFIKSKANCYGYALHVYSTDETLDHAYQYPGDFTSAAALNHSIINEYTGADGSGQANLEYLKNRIYSGIANDLALFGGYEYTNTTIAVTAGYRTIALALRNNDFHFYMRHDDGTWSHKNGHGDVTNLSLISNTPLTDANIATKGQEGSYNAAPIVFYNIQKDAVIDYPHIYGNSSAANSWEEYIDRAGASISKSEAISTGTKKCRIDYSGDVDWFQFNCPPGTYRITSTSPDGLDIDLDFCNSSGTVLTQEHNTGNVNKVVSLVGTRYYIKVWCKNSSASGKYTLTIVSN